MYCNSYLAWRKGEGKKNEIRASMEDAFYLAFQEKSVGFFCLFLFLNSLKLRLSTRSPDKTELIISVCQQGSALSITGEVSDKCKLQVGIALGFDSGQGHASQSSAGIKMCLLTA